MSVLCMLTQIEGLEAHVGRRGRIRVRGGLPLTATDAQTAEAAVTAAAGTDSARAKDSAGAALIMDVHGLEMRMRNVYTGEPFLALHFHNSFHFLWKPCHLCNPCSHITLLSDPSHAGYLDAALRLQNSIMAPVVGGDVRFSRGVASLLPGGPSPPGGSSSGSSGGGSGGGSATGGVLRGSRRGREGDLLFKAFTVLTRKDALARQLSRLDLQQARYPALAYAAFLSPD
jgi:hypothetical protein